MGQIGYTEPNVQVVTTPSGLTAYLVQSPSLPMLSMEISFRAGTAYEPAEQHGVANLMAALLDEGAGDLPAKNFQEALENIGARLGAGSDMLDVEIHLTTLTKHQDAAFNLLRLALTQPRFDPDAVARVQDAILTNLKREQENPNSVASRVLMSALFPGHPYGRHPDGTLASVPALTRAQLVAYHQQALRRGNMVISVVGDIAPDALATLLERTLGDIPNGTAVPTVPAPEPLPASVHKIEMDVPQADIMLAHRAMTRQDPDYYAAYVLNDMLGGSGFTSRIFNEVREKNGLAYSAYSRFVPFPNTGYFLARAQTNNADAAKALAMMRAEIVKIKTAGVSAEELADSQLNLTGSFPLMLDSNRKILGFLTLMQQENLGVGYLNRWPEHIKAVTMADVQRAAERFLRPDDLLTVIVGGPAALQ